MILLLRDISGAAFYGSLTLLLLPIFAVMRTLRFVHITAKIQICRRSPAAATTTTTTPAFRTLSSSSNTRATFPPIVTQEIAGIKTELQTWEPLNHIISSQKMVNPVGLVPAAQAHKKLKKDIPGGGATISSPSSSRQEYDLLFVLFPGNPGAVAFYQTFMAHLQSTAAATTTSTTTSSTAFITVGHISHSIHSRNGRELFNLKSQIQHKVKVVKYLMLLHPHAKIILAGHSVGAHMVLEVMKELTLLKKTHEGQMQQQQQQQQRIISGILLFPTVMHIGATVNGKKLMPLFRFGRGAMYLAAAIAHYCLPLSMQRWLAQQQLPVGSTDVSIDACLSIVHPDVAANALWMALHEMNEILSLDVESARQLQEKLVFYFAEKDDWVGVDDPDLIEKLYLPKAKVVRCTEGHKHAFVLNPKSCESLAEKTWSWISAHYAPSPGEDEGGGKGKQQRAKERKK